MSNRRDLTDNLFSEDEFLNSAQGDVFVGYGRISDNKIPSVDEYLQLPGVDYDPDPDPEPELIGETIEIPRPAGDRIVLDASDSGSDSGISGEHPQTAAHPGAGPADLFLRLPAPGTPMDCDRAARLASLSPPFVSPGASCIIARQPTSVRRPQSSSRPTSLLLGPGRTSGPRPGAEVLAAQSLESAPVTGVVLTAGEYLLAPAGPGPSDEEATEVDPKLHSILQSKVKIQPRPHAEAQAGGQPQVVQAGVCPASYVPAVKRARPAAAVKTVVPTMVTGEDTAEIVYTPQTTYVLSGSREAISLPPSLQVKSEPVFSPSFPSAFSPACITEQPVLAAGELAGQEIPEHIFLSMLSSASGLQRLGHAEEQLGKLSVSGPIPTDPMERGRLVKKQERMIKNRQAASLSRQRKKEYLETLEGTLDALRKENRELRKSNQDIRRRYDELLRKIDSLERQSESLLADPAGPGLALLSSPSSSSSCSSAASSCSVGPGQVSRIVGGAVVDQIDYAPHLRRKAATVTSAIAATSVLAVFCLFLLNVNSSLSPLGPNPALLDQRRTGEEPRLGAGSAGMFGLRAGAASAAASRNLLSIPVEALAQTQPQCPVVPFNGTESHRVAFELNRWAAQYKKEAKLAFLRSLWQQRSNAKWHRRHWETSARRMKRSGGRPVRHMAQNAIQIHRTPAGDPRMDQLMFGFRRQNDTMYFVSLTGEHFIFPALNTSKSRQSRPRVSFIMPAIFGLNETVRPGRDRIAMMQIDTEVLNYTVFHVDKRHLSSYFNLNHFWPTYKSSWWNVRPDQQ